MIGAKKRFEVLKRDWFKCQYCWKTGKDVTLEVDHVIPKKEWWSDSMDNLICSCRECNMWKWSDVIQKPAKNLYKQKIKDNTYRIKTYMYDKWNKQYMGSVDKKTSVLIAMYLEWTYWWTNYYPYANNDDNVKKFNIWSDYCDEILEELYLEWVSGVDDILEECYIDNKWLPKNNTDKDRYSNRLNYYLTNMFNDNILDWYPVVEKYVLYKYSLHHNLIGNE